MLRTSLLRRLALEMMILSPVSALTRVVFSPIASTVPTLVSQPIGSPFLKGLSNRIESAANRSENMPCAARPIAMPPRSEEHTSELQSLMRISYAVFCLKKKKNNTQYESVSLRLLSSKSRHVVHSITECPSSIDRQI